MTAVNLNRVIRGPVTAVPVVAGKGVRLVADTANNRFVAEADETVLYSGTQAGAGTINLNESWANFEFIEMFGYNDEGKFTMHAKFSTADLIAIGSGYEVEFSGNGFSTWFGADYYVYVTVPCTFSPSTPTVVTVSNQRYVGKWGGSWQASSNNRTESKITRIVGINRIASN